MFSDIASDRHIIKIHFSNLVLPISPQQIIDKLKTSNFKIPVLGSRPSPKSVPPTRTLWRRRQRLRYIYANLMGRLSAPSSSSTTTDAADAAADLIFNMLKKRPLRRRRQRQHRCHRRRRRRRRLRRSIAPVFIFKSVLPNEKRQFTLLFPRSNVDC